jgi:hypothetical protein
LFLLWTLFCFYAVARGLVLWAFIWVLPGLAGIVIGLLVRRKEQKEQKVVTAPPMDFPQ